MTILLSTDLLATTLPLLLHPLLQIFTSIPSSQITGPSNNLLHTSHLSSSFPLTGPTVFPGGPPEFPYLGVPLPGTSSTPSGTVSLPSYPIPSMFVPTTQSIPLLPIEPQPISGFEPTEGVVEDPGALILEGRESPGAEEAEPSPPPVAKLLPSPAIFGLAISHPWSLPGVLLLVQP